MPALAQPTGAQIIATLMPGGDGGQLGAWTADAIDDYVTNALVNEVSQEFDYASEVLTDAGYTPASLTQAQWDIATMAMVYGIAYQLLVVDRVSQSTISGEMNGGIRDFAYVSGNYSYSDLADLEWLKLGITSRYSRNYTAGFGVNSTTRNIYENGSNCDLYSIDN